MAARKRKKIEGASRNIYIVTYTRDTANGTKEFENQYAADVYATAELMAQDIDYIYTSQIISIKRTDQRVTYAFPVV